MICFSWDALATMNCRRFLERMLQGRAVGLFRPASGVCSECCTVCCSRHGIVEIVATWSSNRQIFVQRRVRCWYIYIFPMLRLRHINTTLAAFAAQKKKKNDKEVPHKDQHGTWTWWFPRFCCYYLLNYASEFVVTQGECQQGTVVFAWLTCRPFQILLISTDRWRRFAQRYTVFRVPPNCMCHCFQGD